VILLLDHGDLQAAAASKMVHGSCDPDDVIEKDGGVSGSHSSSDVTDGGDHVSPGVEKLVKQ